MSIPKLTNDTAKAIYEYAGTDGLPKYEDLAPTVQISYIEEAEAALTTVAKYVQFMAENVDPQCDEEYYVKASILSIAHMIDPKKPELIPDDEDA
jgi:hypothetical protein